MADCIFFHKLFLFKKHTSSPTPSTEKRVLGKKSRPNFPENPYFPPARILKNTERCLEDNYVENSLSRITRTRSCPATSRHRNSARSSAVPSIPVRAISLVQSESYDLSDCRSRSRGAIQRSLTYNSSLRRNNQLSIRSEQSQVISLGSDISENVF